jgi:uncharacterized protein YqeY
MSIEERIAGDMKKALKQGHKDRLAVLRLAKARLQEATVDLRSRRGRDARLDEAEATAVIAACAKQRREAAESFRQAGREDLAAREETELAILHEYLPRQLGEDEIREQVRQAIAETGASSPKDLGAVMKAVMPKLKGAADGKQVNQIARELLAGS